MLQISYCQYRHLADKAVQPAAVKGFVVTDSDVLCCRAAVGCQFRKVNLSALGVTFDRSAATLKVLLPASRRVPPLMVRPTFWPAAGLPKPKVALFKYVITVLSVDEPSLVFNTALSLNSTVALSAYTAYASVLVALSALAPIVIVPLGVPLSVFALKVITAPLSAYTP